MMHENIQKRVIQQVDVVQEAVRELLSLSCEHVEGDILIVKGLDDSDYGFIIAKQDILSYMLDDGGSEGEIVMSRDGG